MVSPTNHDDDAEVAAVRHFSMAWCDVRGLFMYKFMFIALVGSAVFPDWPVQAVFKGQAVIESIQNSSGEVIRLTSTQTDG